MNKPKPKEEVKKSYWNYRVVKEADKKLKGLPQSYSYTIRDVYYENGKPTSWGTEPQYAVGETFDDLFVDLHNMQNAMSAKVLEIKDGKLVETKRFGL